MTLLFRNWLEEGYYEEDGLGDLTKIEESKDIYEAFNNGTLYEHDGLAMTKFMIKIQLKIKKITK
jgi:hypothetical protein